jgi:hypothetical protein
MTTADFRPSHVVPQDGLPAWEAPDAGRPTTSLDALLPVRLVDRLGDWGRIVCANGWSAWLDARLLVAVPADPPAAGHPLTRTADPRPLLTRAEEALGRYRLAVEELAGGTTEAESFRHRTRGLRVGVVVDGESVWLYDAEHERWVFCDGTRLSTYAVGSEPSTSAPEADLTDAAYDEVGTARASSVGGESGGESGGAGPEATRVAEPVSAASRPPDGPRGAVPPPEATQVVEAASDEGRAPAAYSGDG